MFLVVGMRRSRADPTALADLALAAGMRRARQASLAAANGASPAAANN
jgi:hypothetical protein